MQVTEQWLRDRLSTRQGSGLRSDVAIALSLGLDPAEGSTLGRPSGEGTRPAAVLVPLVQRPDGLQVMLTRRTDHLHHHAGQISFPGGRQEDSDDGPIGCALRETVEETGLDARHVTVLGTLDEYVTVTGFRVIPVVGLVQPPFTLAPDPFEVAEVFEVPLAFVMNPQNHQKVARTVNGRPRPYYAIPYETYYIWGATAGMLMNLYNVLRD